MQRRNFLKSLAALPGLGRLYAQAGTKFKISLAEWSLHRALETRVITNLDFPRIARDLFGIQGLEFVNGLWQAPTWDYIRRLQANMDKTQTKGVLIMCDGEGLMGHSDRAQRMRAAQNHRKWVDIASDLGCHSIRTNMYSDVNPKIDAEIEQVLEYCAQSFNDLCGYAQAKNVNVIIENHGGISSNPDVVVRLMKKVNLPNFGTLPDFGNFPKEVDRYEAVKKMMRYAKGVSFKCYDFAPDGSETRMDVPKLMKIVQDAGYNSFVGIEYEGSRLGEFEGIAAAKRLLDRLNA